MLQASLPNALRRLPRQTRSILLTCLYGAVAGLAAVAFQAAMNRGYVEGIERLATGSTRTFLVGSFLMLVGSSAAVGWLLTRFCREAAGSGIPQLKVAFWKDFGYAPWRLVWVKFVAGVLSIGGGSSLGREGPSVQLAGALASNLAAWAGEPKQNRRAASAAGAAAGLAAAFNTPLAAVTFVLEEIIGDLNSRWLGSVLLASILGALVVHGCIGPQPAFTIASTTAPTWLGYALTPLVAGLAALVGVYFQRLALRLRAEIKRRPGRAAWLWPCLGGVVTWGLGATVFSLTGHLGVFSLGYDDLSHALQGDLGWQIALLLLGTKFIATFACYGGGGCGGIFSPTLFFGGMTGVAVAGALTWTVHLCGGHLAVATPDLLALTVVGMSACLGAVVWAPVTGILIVFEMTHEFGLVPALMIAALISQTVSRRMNRHNFYDALIAQDGHRLDHVRPPRDLQGWQQLPVSAIANFRPVVVEDLGATALETLLHTHPYQRFPVVIDGSVRGLLTRNEAGAAVREGRTPNLNAAVHCLAGDPIRQLQARLIQSDDGLVLVLDREGGRLLGLVTMHDLLRAQTAIAESGPQG